MRRSEVISAKYARFLSRQIFHSLGISTQYSRHCNHRIRCGLPWTEKSNLFRGSTGSTIALAGNKEDHLSEFEEVRVPSIDGRGDAAVGWIAHSSYLGAIPKGNRIRGIRVRMGNIQVGDERVLDHLFEEDRFNRWCVGEVHVLDSRIIPNGRRDYFERDPHLRNLENHLFPIFRHMTARCRSASSNRNTEKKLVSTFVDLEAMYDFASSGCLSPDDSKAFIGGRWHK